jgi:hypothetical protein
LLSDASADAPAVQDSGAIVVAERTPVADDSDSLTKSTIVKMCEYIRSSAADRNVQGAAQFAAQRFGRGINDAYSNAWGVFWFLKHRVRKVLDEGNMFRVGEPGASDLLIAPSVLLRMDNPAEDCDGFTMAAASMLLALGVPQCIVSVACDPRESQRWSHVFGMVQLANGDWMPLDCSHGIAPGWMVPQQRISRWQAWDLDGNPIDVQMPVRSYLKGYVRMAGFGRRRGMGQSDSMNVCDPSSMLYDMATCLGQSTTVPVSSTDLTLPTVAPITSNPQPFEASTNWGALFASMAPTLAADATKVASIAELPAGASLSNTGAVISSSLTSLMPLIMLGLGAFLIVSLIGSAGKK